MSSKENDDFATFVIMAVAVIIGVVTWKFSETFGLPWQISLEVLGWMFATCLVAGVWKYFSRMNYTPFPIWPLVVAALYFSWFPAIDHWGVSTQAFASLSYAEDFREYAEIAWYARWYTKTILLLSIIIGGYLLDSKIKES